MRFFRYVAFTALLSSLLAGAEKVNAGIVYYSSHSAFAAQGPIDTITNYDDFGPGLHGISQLSRNGVTLTQASYIIGPNTVASNGNPPLIWNPIRDMPLFAFSSQIAAHIDASPDLYGMLGFKVGYLPNFNPQPTDPVTAFIQITTNLATYNFSLPMPASSQSLAFHGFVSDNPNEHFTDIFVQGPTTYFPGITDIELGNVQIQGGNAVPAPSGLILASIGGLVFGFVRLKRNRKIAG